MRNGFNLIAILGLVITLMPCIKAGDPHSMEYIQIFTTSECHYKEPIGHDYLYIEKVDFAKGKESIIDSLDAEPYNFYRGFNSIYYDLNNRRIFFDRLLYDKENYLNVLDLNTKQITELPYAAFAGYFEDIIITPQSKYIIFECLPESIDTTIDVIYQINTVVLDGKTLRKLAEKIDMGLMLQSAFVLPANDRLYDVRFHPKDEIVTYSLPDLAPLDTIRDYELGWLGQKGIADRSGNTILFTGLKIDNADSSLCAFLYDGVSQKICSDIITLPKEYYRYANIRLTPDAREIIIMDGDLGIIERYSANTGELLGQMQGLPIIELAGFREDGNLYVSDLNTGNYIVIDYKKCRILRTFKFKRVTR